MIRNDKGFTLLEVLVSITILSIVLITFFAFFSQGMLFSSKNDEKLTAVNLATRSLSLLQEYSDPLTFQNNELVVDEALKNFLYENNEDYFLVNNEKYFLTVTQVGSIEFSLQAVQVKIFNEEMKLLSEIYGYIKQ